MSLLLLYNYFPPHARPAHGLKMPHYTGKETVVSLGGALYPTVVAQYAMQ
jgi:hypothetical protein